MLSVGSLAIVACPAPTPTLLSAPPHPWVLRELPFLVPLIQAPHGPWHWVCMALRSFFSSGSGHPCCAHTSLHDTQGLPFSASSPALCLASLPWCPQPRGPPAAPLPRWGWGDLELWGSCYLPSCIRGGSCRGLIPVGIGAIKSDPPSLLLCEELVSLAGAVGQEAPWQQQGQGSALRREALGMDRDTGPWQNQFSTNHRAGPQCF